MNSFKIFYKPHIFTSVQKEVWIGWFSSLIEAFNMAIYSFLAPFLARFLFQNTENAVFFSYALILIDSYFLYPLGAIYYGYIGDQQGRQRTCVYSTLGIILTACASLVIGPIHSWMLHQFEAKNRCRGIFISSAIATSIFGGSTIPICLMIFEKFHSSFACCIYPLVLAMGSFVCLKHNRKTHEVLA